MRWMSFQNHSVTHLFLLWLGFAGIVFVRGWLDDAGMISMDGPHYLEVAQNVLDGRGLVYTPEGLSDQLSPSGFDYAAIWPWGYPVGIAAVAELCHLPVTWAFRVLNLLLVALLFGVLRALFREDAPVFALVLYWASPLVAFSSAWSEVPFVVAMMGMVWAVSHLLRQPDWQGWMVLGLSWGLSFLFRYIGVFGWLVMGVLMIRFIRQKSWRSVWNLAVVSGSIGGLMGLYLWINHLKTGYWTGMNREHLGGFPLDVIAKSLIEMLPLFGLPLNLQRLPAMYALGVVALQAALMLGIGFRFRFDFIQTVKTQTERAQHAPALWIVGGSYLVTILCIRTLQGGDFNDRMLLPAFMLGWWALLHHLLHQGARVWIRSLWMGITLASVLVHVVAWSGLQIQRYGWSGGYAQRQVRVMNESRLIPSGSIVAFGDVHLNYLRPDLVVIQPFYRPFAHQTERVQAFINRMKRGLPNRHLYWSLNNDTWNGKTVRVPYFDADFVALMRDAPAFSVQNVY